jgi:peptidoglycan/LPS O-acetylase OafA/YrhL
MKHTQILSLNAIRGIAALMVVFSHFQKYKIGNFGTAQQGHFGVMIFFTLGGFLMGYLYLHKDFKAVNVIAYIISRFSRIAPPYLITIILSFLIYNFIDPFFSYAIDSQNIVRHLLFSGNISVFWSIPPEVQFYILFIFIWLAVFLAVNKRRLSLVVILSILLIFLIVERDKFPGTFIG